MYSEEHALTLNSESGFDETNRGNGSKDEKNITFRMKQVLYLAMAGVPAEEIAEQLGYAGKFTVYQVLRNPKVRKLEQEIMDYYDGEFRRLYPEVIESVKGGLQSADEKVQLEASKIWLRSHGKMEPKQNQSAQGPTIAVENLVANILVQARERRSERNERSKLEPRSDSDRKLIQDTEQRKINRRFQTESEPAKVRRSKN